MKPIKSKRVRIVEDFKFTIHGEELLQIINQELAAQGKTRIPTDADIYVQVPGGVDWSNEPLSLNDYPLQIEWTIESETDE